MLLSKQLHQTINDANLIELADGSTINRSIHWDMFNKKGAPK